jgi:DNA polymerase II large subunit
LLAAQEKMGFRAQEPFKGVKELISQDRIAEPLEKGLARQNFGLTTFKDGTVRFDATNSPITQFKPSWIGTSIEKLKELGYTNDIDGNPITNSEQIVEIRMQDVIIPYESGKYLVSTCKYIDTLLKKFYGKNPFYNVKNSEELIGHLVIGLAPHTSVGIVGRVIGFTETHVCFATPNWHSAKRRDADGDADSIMLLMDSLLNFSRQFLSDRIGGLMDAPLLIQPLVLPHESQPQAHNLEVTKSLPLEFFKSTLQQNKASSVNSVEIIESRLETERQFYDYYFTHQTSSLTTSKSRSAYSTLGSMLDKLDMQIRNADMIDAVNTSEIVSNVISTHLVPDIMGNLRAYARQSFRCTACGKSYRRLPLTQNCVCNHKLIQTITRGSVEKYLKLAKRLVNNYDVGEYQKGRIHALSDEIDLVFGKNSGDQSLLTDYAS